ncbi:MAG: Crp/Fnr family transcriptional regulator [Cytophagales bacterium]
MVADLKYWYLKDHQLFRNLSFSEIDSLCILKKFKKSKKNETIDLPHDDKERIYLLKHGTIKLIRIDEDGEEQLIDILQKGDIFGEIGLDKNGNHSDFIKVVSDEAILCTFFRDKLEELMVKKPDFAINYIKFIGFNYTKLKNNYKNIFFKDAKTRLLLLLNTIIEKEKLNNNPLTLPNYLTQKDLAQLICITRQSIITLLKELENEGILEYTQKEIKVLNYEKIKEVVSKVK